MDDSARDEAFARANAIHEAWLRNELTRQRSTLGVPPPDVVDDPDEPLLDESRIQANPDDGPNMARRYEADAENPTYPSGHPVPRRKGDPILPWRSLWRRLRRKRKG